MRKLQVLQVVPFSILMVDGPSEIVYRDEDFLYILNGNNGSVNTSIPCRSRTSVEYPIVADVDADGSTEICIVCAS